MIHGSGYVIMQTEDDMRWWVDGDHHHWELPPVAAWWARRAPARWFRAIIATYHVVRHEEFFSRLGMISTGYDRWVLYAIWRGWC